MKMGTFFSIGKLACVALLAVIFALHHNVIISPAIQVATLPGLSRTVTTHDEKIVELERRVTSLEAANIPVQLAALQAQAAIDHQILLAMALMMFTLALEAMWRMAGKSKTRAGD